MEREIKLWSGTKMYESDLKAILTLDNIFKYASYDELRAIVSSIIGRLNEMPNCYCSNCNLYYTYSITDKDLDIFVKELRDVK